MRFSTREQYGLRAMVELARSYGQGPVSLADVAQAEGLSLSYLEQIVVPLRKAGLIDSQRGARGGYSLAHDPSQITAGDVIRTLEGTLVHVPCLPAQVESCCPRQTACATRDVWAEVRRNLVETLDAITLEDLLQQSTETSCRVLFGEGYT